MKKGIIITALFFVLGFALYLFTDVFQWMGLIRDTDTFEVYINKTTIGNENYTKDSLAISTQLKRFLLKQDDPGFSSEARHGTKIIIDTIAYSPDLNKLAVLIITQSSASTGPDSVEGFYYNATRFLGVRQKDSISLRWLGPTFTNSTDKPEMSKAIREACFRNSERKDTTGLYSYKYNMNDNRFWTSSLWKEKEVDKIRRKEFEEVKVKHLERGYENGK